MNTCQTPRIRRAIGLALGAGSLVAALLCGAGVASADYGGWTTGVDKNGWWMKLRFNAPNFASDPMPMPCTLWFSPGSGTMQRSVDPSGVVLFDHVPLNDPTKIGAGATCVTPGNPEGFQVPVQVVGSTSLGMIESICSLPPCPPPSVWTTPS